MTRSRASMLAAFVSLCLFLAATAEASPGAGPTNAAHHKPSPTPQALALQGEQLVDQMVLRSDRIRTWLREARHAKLTVRARCLNTLLSQLHAAEKRGQEAQLSLRYAARKGKVAPRGLTRLTHLAERSRRLGEEAYWCGKTRSKRVRLPTTYQVRVDRPRLPARANPPSYVRRIDR